VHIVTVNDYLRSATPSGWGKIFNFLGLSGVNLSAHGPRGQAQGLSPPTSPTDQRNNEFGFDYLRDKMAMRVEERFQRGLNLRHRRTRSTRS